MNKKHHPRNKFERLQLEAIKKEKRAREETANVRRRAAQLEEKEAEDAIREEVC